MTLLCVLLRNGREWSYRLFGPSTLHLQHEACLLVALTLMGVSSLCTVYRNSPPIRGDSVFVALLSGWLSRHLLVRWVCTSDLSTNRSPTCVGVVAHCLTSSVIGAGHYFDRPPLHIVSRQTGITSVDDGRATVFNLSLYIPSVMYALQYFKVGLWYPLLSLWETLATKLSERQQQQQQQQPKRSLNGRPTDDHVRNGRSSDGTGQGGDQNPIPAGGNGRRAKSSQSAHGDHGRSARRRNQRQSQSQRTNLGSSYQARRLVHAWWKFASRYGPSVQLLIPLAVVTFYVWRLVFGSAAPDETTAALSMNPQAAVGQKDGVPVDFEDDSEPHGAYQRMDRPEWSQVALLLSCGGMLASILFFARIFVPFPDLVAGCNVLKAIRNEARNSAHQGTSRSRSRSHKDSFEVPWAERHRSIAHDNRFRLICKALSIRMLENIVLCVFFPRTNFLCRASGHCSEGTPIWELSKILYYAGVTSTLRDDFDPSHRFHVFFHDRTITVLAVASTAIITMSLLLVQAATLNRSYLGIMGYLAGEWTIVDKSELDLSKGATPANWDPRRKYKKGDIIVQNTPGIKGQLYYKAVSNSPEGRPLDLHLRATHDLFRDEAGSPVKSEVISNTCLLQTLFLTVLLVTFSWYRMMGYQTDGMVVMIAANIVGLVGTSNVGLPDYRGIASLANEISS